MNNLPSINKCSKSQLIEYIRRLTVHEQNQRTCNFLFSIKMYLQDHGKLTNKQKDVLKKIYKERVENPKGKALNGFPFSAPIDFNNPYGMTPRRY